MEPLPIPSQFDHQDYMTLETDRRDGTPVTTPVWFVEQEGVLYFRTMASSGKVKRLRRNPSLRVVASDFRGNPLGEWIDATAVLQDAAETRRINDLMTQKYGMKKWFLDIFGGMNRGEQVIYAVHLKTGETSL
ncbi:MAG: PPOX class F420-dependent oxidoreductase [Anaerolineaceae bacterium]